MEMSNITATQGYIIKYMNVHYSSIDISVQGMFVTRSYETVEKRSWSNLNAFPKSYVNKYVYFLYFLFQDARVRSDKHIALEDTYTS